jgi:hypothetical protein
LSRKGRRPRGGRPNPPKKQKVANQFVLNYGPDFLQHAGPYIGAQWSVPPALEAELKRQGKAVPAPVQGYLLLDTGAEKTCIAKVAAEKLELKPIDRVQGFGAGGQHVLDVTLARLTISIRDSRGITTAMWWDQAVQCVPDLEKHPQARGIQVGGKTADLTGLLGRDILRLTTVMYNGREGRVQVTFDRNWIIQQAVAAPTHS